MFLPKSWTDDRERCQAAGVPDEVSFATKVTHGRRMLARALDAGVPAAWATAAWPSYTILDIDLDYFAGVDATDADLLPGDLHGALRADDAVWSGRPGAPGRPEVVRM